MGERRVDLELCGSPAVCATGWVWAKLPADVTATGVTTVGPSGEEPRFASGISGKINEPGDGWRALPPGPASYGLTGGGMGDHRAHVVPAAADPRSPVDRPVAATTTAAGAGGKTIGGCVMTPVCCCLNQADPIPRSAGFGRLRAIPCRRIDSICAGSRVWHTNTVAPGPAWLHPLMMGSAVISASPSHHARAGRTERTVGANDPPSPTSNPTQPDTPKQPDQPGSRDSPKARSPVFI